MRIIRTPMRRRAPRQYASDSYYLPISLIERIQQVADTDAGGNKSALVTEILARELGVTTPETEVIPEKR
jgi:hypothetical protein